MLLWVRKYAMWTMPFCVFVRDASPVHVTYQIISQTTSDGMAESVVSLSQSGVILSSDRTGSAVLLVTAREDFGVNQTVQVLVKVSSVCLYPLSKGHKPVCKT